MTILTKKEIVESIANQLSTKASSMESLLNSVSEQLNKVGNEGTWSGTSASAAYEEFNKLMQKFPEFYEAVQNCSKYLNKVVQTYKSVDSQVVGQ